MTDIPDDEIDAGARALREREQGGRILRNWANLPNSDKRKWRDKASVVLCAAYAAKMERRAP